MPHTASPSQPVQGALFAEEALPHGLLYRPDFLSPAEEAGLLGHIAHLPFVAARYQDYTARRRVVRYGEFDDPNYAEAASDAPGQRRPFPDFLLPLRRRIAQWQSIDEADFVHGLVTEYAPGTPIGWHSDAPHFGVVAGVSLAGAARMQFRRYESGSTRAARQRVFEIQLAPRSVYLMQGEIRLSWQHHLPPVSALRYSITFRTLRAGR